MAERKVQSKYVPPDFDHRVLKAVQAKEPKRKTKLEKEKKETVRVMLPFNVCCSKCNQYMYRGRKFNGRKEEGADPDYMGTKIIRFHVKCDTCSNPIVFRTDPKAAGFTMVSGARENKTTAGDYNPLAGVVEKDDVQADNLDPVAALEARALETKREMEVLQELEREMKKSDARMAILSKLGNTAAASGVREDGPIDDADMSGAMRSYQEQKRLLQLNGENSKASQVETNNRLSSGAKDNGSESDNEVNVTVVRKKITAAESMAKKPKFTSLVSYDDDSE